MLMKLHRWIGGSGTARQSPSFEEVLVNLEYIVAIFPTTSDDDKRIQSRIHLSDISEPYHTMHVMESLNDFQAFEGR